MARGGARPGAGRPSKPHAEQRRNPTVIKLTDGERRELERAAKAKGESVSELVRGIVFRALRRRK